MFIIYPLRVYVNKISKTPRQSDTKPEYMLIMCFYPAANTFMSKTIVFDESSLHLLQPPEVVAVHHFHQSCHHRRRHGTAEHHGKLTYWHILQHGIDNFGKFLHALAVSGGSLPLYMIPVMIFLPVLIGVVVGFPTGLLLKKANGKAANLAVLLGGITATMVIDWLLNTYLLSGVTLNYMLMGVSFSAVFSNMITSEQLEDINRYFAPILGISLLTAIVDLGAPLDYHLILGAGIGTDCTGYHCSGSCHQ